MRIHSSSRKEKLENANKDVPTLCFLRVTEGVSPDERWILRQKEVVMSFTLFKTRGCVENSRLVFFGYLVDWFGFWLSVVFFSHTLL